MEMRSVRISIFTIVAVLVSVGIVMIYSASAIYAYGSTGDSLYFLKRHLIYLSLGVMMMFFTMTLDLEALRRWSKPVMIASVALLVAVLIPHIGRETAGARRWFRFGIVNFQPSELAKVAMIVYMADFIARKKELMKSFLHGYVPAMIALGAVVGLVLLEPDLGTAVTISLVSFIMMYVSGVRGSYIAASFLASLPLLYALLFRVAYRRKRMMVFLNPWADKRGTGFQIIQSFIALGSGGIFGLGLGQSRQKLFYLPASHTDFIFSIIGEELGFLGTASIVVLFALFVWEGMKVAFRAPEAFGRMLALAVTSLVAIEAIINIGVTAGALAAVGLLLNVARTCETVR
jgi:cell division protein FtsW